MFFHWQLLKFRYLSLVKKVALNFKKIDDKDFVFVNKPLSEKEEKEFNNFLKTRKAKQKQTSSATKTIHR
jgi:hypothetical protein